MVQDSPEPTRSPWSTPTESEIIEATEKSVLSNQKDAAFKELGLKVKEPITNKKLSKKQTNMSAIKDHSKKELPSSPKKRTSKKGKQRDAGEKGKNSDADNNETKEGDDASNDNQITDITIPNVIPPPPGEETDRGEPTVRDADDVGEIDDVKATEKLDLGDDKIPDSGSSPRGSKIGLQEEGESSSPTKRGNKNTKTSDKKNPVKKKGVPKNDVKRSRSNSPEKPVSKGKSRKESLSVDQNSAGSQDRTESPNSRGSGDSLKLGADYTTINGEVNNESGSSVGANNLENGDENVFDQAKPTTERNDSPKKRKSKIHSSLRRESVADKKTAQNAPTRSNSPKKAQKGKRKPQTISPGGSEKDPNKWSSEVQEMEKWNRLATANGRIDPEQVADIINSESSANVNVKEDEAGNKKTLKRRESKAQPKSPSKESPKKSPPKSPTKSPNKSPRKKLKDVLQLPPPYDEITSGKLRHWEQVASKGEKIDEEKYPEYEHVRHDTLIFLLLHIFQLFIN